MRPHIGNFSRPHYLIGAHWRWAGAQVSLEFHLREVSSATLRGPRNRHLPSYISKSWKKTVGRTRRQIWPNSSCAGEGTYRASGRASERANERRGAASALYYTRFNSRRRLSSARREYFTSFKVATKVRQQQQQPPRRRRRRCIACSGH